MSTPLLHNSIGHPTLIRKEELMKGLEVKVISSTDKEINVTWHIANNVDNIKEGK